MTLDSQNEQHLSSLLNNGFSTWKKIEPLYEEKALLSPQTPPEPSNDPPGTLYWAHYNQRHDALDKEIANRITEAQKTVEPTLNDMPPHMQEIARDTFNMTCYGQFGTSEKCAKEHFENELVVKEKENVDPPMHMLEGLTPEQRHEMENQWANEIENRINPRSEPGHEPAEPQHEAEYEPDDDD